MIAREAIESRKKEGHVNCSRIKGVNSRSNERTEGYKRAHRVLEYQSIKSIRKMRKKSEGDNKQKQYFKRHCRPLIFPVVPRFS
jgi:hypothetical protein